MSLALRASGLWLRYAALQNLIPSFPWDASPTPSTLAQSKERKGSNFAIWQPCLQNYRPGWLPRRLRNWHFLPLCLRSLKPLDDLITSTSCAKSLLPTLKEPEDEETKNLTGSAPVSRPADSAKFLAAGCCTGATAVSTAGNSPGIQFNRENFGS